VYDKLQRGGQEPLELRFAETDDVSSQLSY